MINREETKESNGDDNNLDRTKEWSSNQEILWRDILSHHVDSQEALDILDIEKSSRLFAHILSEQGHHVTTSDVNEFDLPDESFDIIISRYSIGDCEDPNWMYSEMKRMLRSGGKLLIYDANWQERYSDEDAALPLINTDRPKWDKTVLDRLGLDVAIRDDISQFVDVDSVQERYEGAPLFEICAVKSSMSKEKEEIHDYWQKRSSTFGFLLNEESIQPWTEPIKRHLTKGPLKVLDVGTGTGSIAAVTATLGHDVTGIDLCSNMIEEAKQNAQESELDISFMCTDAGELPFEDNTFDVVISRNVVWALMNPEEALLQWKRVLKPGGTLFYFDGNHYYYLFDEEDNKAREAYAAITGTAYVNHPEEIDYSEMEQAALKLPLSKYNRPYEWDNKVLPELGFQIEAIETKRPQDLLKEGIAEGFYTSFHVVAKKQ